MVRNGIPRDCFYICSTERNSELFSLPLECSEGNPERLLLIFVQRNGIPSSFSSAEGFGTEFRDFLFRGTAGIPPEITLCSVYSVFRGIIFLSEIPNPRRRAGSEFGPKCHGSRTLVVIVPLPNQNSAGPSNLSLPQLCHNKSMKTSVANPGCLSRIPHPNFSLPDQKDSGSRIRNRDFKYFLPACSSPGELLGLFQTQPEIKRQS